MVAYEDLSALPETIFFCNLYINFLIITLFGGKVTPSAYGLERGVVKVFPDSVFVWVLYAL
jgi:hypothetical protein